MVEPAVDRRSAAPDPAPAHTGGAGEDSAARDACDVNAAGGVGELLGGVGAGAGGVHAVIRLEVQELSAGLLGALDRLGDQAPGLPGETLGEDIKQTYRLVEMVRGRLHALVGVFDDQQGYTSAGLATTPMWLQSEVLLSGARAADEAAAARRLRAHPQAAQAVAGGRIRGEQARMVLSRIDRVAKTARAAATRAAALGDVATEEQARQVVTTCIDPDTEQSLLGVAAPVDPDRLRYVLDEWWFTVDREGFLNDANAKHDRRYLRFTTSPDGMTALSGRLDPVGGATVLNAVNALANPKSPDNPDRGAEAATRRTRGQANADALVELCRRALDAGDLPEAGGQAPHVSVTVPLDTLLEAPGAPAALLEPGAGLGAVPAVVTPQTARRLACEALVCRVLTGPAGVPLEMGRRTRVPTAAQRTALAIRDGGCRFPGCPRPAVWAAAHHLKHWAHGGDTDLCNLILLCEFHHHAAHEGGWHIEGDPSGPVTFHRRGTVLLSYPACYLQPP